MERPVLMTSFHFTISVAKDLTPGYISTYFPYQFKAVTTYFSDL
jgi:hypothetical protein